MLYLYSSLAALQYLTVVQYYSQKKKNEMFRQNSENKLRKRISASHNDREWQTNIRPAG